eukprot:TRINITY_DN8473_c0_g1_i1.p1 TRINITY_DN8473_c0_g1~~TRINITY_DN8473_c0_g1_i1.p1  ORF type:complete len:144 (-),score=37.42 TRINITY_DN8473_c0_g1_i1:99-530(-)
MVGRVVLPITDPYIKHHAALGSFATIYLQDKSQIMEAMKLLRNQTGVYTVLGKEDACKGFSLPPDRIGDMVVVGDQDTVMGKSTQHHDLSLVKSLRSHGGIDESVVPFFFNFRLSPAYSKRLTTGKARSFHLFDYLCNGAKQD